MAKHKKVIGKDEKKTDLTDPLKTHELWLEALYYDGIRATLLPPYKVSSK